jgi:hypothetical protein
MTLRASEFVSGAGLPIKALAIFRINIEACTRAGVIERGTIERPYSTILSADSRMDATIRFPSEEAK